MGIIKKWNLKNVVVENKSLNILIEKLDLDLFLFYFFMHFQNQLLTIY